MGFGLTNAPATFARAINLILRGLTWKTVLAFLDDILVIGKSFEDHLGNLVEALERFRQHGLKLKPKKCIFFQNEVEFLGRIVTGNRLKMAQKDCSVVEAWPTPACKRDVQRFLGLVNYHRTFVQNFSRLAEPLYRLTAKDIVFEWGESEQLAFDALKTALTTPPILTLPNHNDRFILDTDASDVAIGSMLSQVQGGKKKK